MQERMLKQMALLISLSMVLTPKLSPARKNPVALPGYRIC